MPNPDDLLEPTSQQPNLRQRIADAAPQQQAQARAVADRLKPPTLTDVVRPGNVNPSLRDDLAKNSLNAQADAKAVQARLNGNAAAPAAEPAASPLRERLQARANAAPGAAEQALRQRMGGGIAQAAQQAVGAPPQLPAPASPAPAAAAPSPASIRVDGAGNAAAPGVARTTMPVAQGPAAVPPSSSRALVPASTPRPGAMVPSGPGATPPSASRAMVPAGPGATPPAADPAAPKAPYSKPGAPPVRPGVAVVNGAGDATVPNPGLRDRITVNANQAQADLKAAADRMVAHPTNVGPQNPNVATLRQSVGLHPVPPGAAGAAEPGVIGKYAGKILGSGEDWAALGAKLKPAGMKLLKASGAMAIGDGAINAYEGIRQGDLGRAAWGVGDAIAGVASFTPAKPIAAAYLGGRAAYEIGHAASEAFGSGKKPAAPAAAPAAKPATAPAAAPAAKPAAAPAEKPAAKPAASPAAAPAQPRPDYSSMAAAARDEALGAIDNEEASDPRAAYYQTVDHNTGTTTYETRDRGQIQVKDGVPLSEDDQKRVDAFTARQQQRDGIHERYQQMLAQLQGEEESGGPVADAARASAGGGGNANVAAFVQQYGEAAKAAGDKLGVDPNLLLTQWGHETGWGKSVIPGTNNLGNIKAVKGQAGVAATDNMTGSRDQYAQYASPHEFADQYVNLVNSRYPGAVGAGSDMGKFATALKAGGYAEDPAYVNKLQAAYKTVLGAAGGAPAQAPAAAGPLPYARDPLAGAIPVMDMANGRTSVTMPGMGEVRDGITMDAYNAARTALKNNPSLAQRMTITDQGPAVDGVLMPLNVLLAGDGAMAKYARNAEQAQRFAANPTAGKIAETAAQGEFNNAGHQIQAGATRYTADQHLEAAKVAASAGNKRYLEMKGGVNQKTFTPEPDMVFDTQSGQYVQRPGGAAPQQGGQQIPPAAIDMLRKQPQTAAQFDAQFGAGASRRYLQGN
jgi:flagellum-specific peptidoglycan hydrolase FlgJ